MVINNVGNKNTLNSNGIKNVLILSDKELFIFRRWQKRIAGGGAPFCLLHSLMVLNTSAIM